MGSARARGADEGVEARDVEMGCYGGRCAAQNVSASQPHVQIQYNACVELRGVVPERVEDSAFWWIFLKPLVFPAAGNGPRMLYESVLPFLNRKPSRANLHDDVRPRPPPPLGYLLL